MWLTRLAGVFLDSAQKFVSMPPPTEADLIKQLDATARDALSKGLTSVHDAGFKPVSLDFFQRCVCSSSSSFNQMLTCE